VESQMRMCFLLDRKWTKSRERKERNRPRWNPGNLRQMQAISGEWRRYTCTTIG